MKEISGHAGPAGVLIESAHAAMGVGAGWTSGGQAGRAGGDNMHHAPPGPIKPQG